MNESMLYVFLDITHNRSANQTFAVESLWLELNLFTILLLPTTPIKFPLVVMKMVGQVVIVKRKCNLVSGVSGTTAIGATSARSNDFSLEPKGGAKSNTLSKRSTF